MARIRCYPIPIGNTVNTRSAHWSISLSLTSSSPKRRNSPMSCCQQRHGGKRTESAQTQSVVSNASALQSHHPATRNPIGGLYLKLRNVSALRASIMTRQNRFSTNSANFHRFMQDWIGNVLTKVPRTSLTTSGPCRTKHIPARRDYTKKPSSTDAVSFPMCTTEIPLRRLAMIFRYGSQQGDACNPITRAHRPADPRELSICCQKNRWK